MNNTRESTEIAKYLFHPTLVMRDRTHAKTFFDKVFQMESVYQRVVMTDPRLSYNDDYPSDYSIYTWLADVWFDTIQPDLYQVKGREDVEPTYGNLIEMGWFVDDVNAALAAAEANGIRITNQVGEVVTTRNAAAAVSGASPDIALFWMEPDDTGLPVEFCYMAPEFAKKFGEVTFPPLTDGWRPPAAAGPNPLTVERCAYHSILTTDVARALRWSRGALGGRVISETLDEVVGTRNTNVWLGQTVLEFAEPLKSEGAAYEAHRNKTLSLAGKVSDDSYWSIGFLVRDLAAAERHLREIDMPFEKIDANRLVIAPENGLGIRWCFTTMAVEGDPR